ncbi:hypothetical protein [Hyphomicrobium sp. 2TAF46]|uniref:hypothetical protein n=1 Tax=Hyphomicrobium sp. 2TAF46 TaxID=3233019 RepID=UPI003F92113A
MWPSHPAASRIAEAHGNVISKIFFAHGKREDKIDPIVVERFVNRTLVTVLPSHPVEIINVADDPRGSMPCV